MDYSRYIAKNVADIPPSGIRKFFDVVSTTKGAISLGVGEPDFVTPWNIRDAAIKSIQKGHTQYTSNWGLLELREEIADYLKHRYNVIVSPKDGLFLTIGASEAIDVAIRALVEPGDEVLIPDPSYVSYSPCVKICGGKAVGVPCREEDEFILTEEALSSVVTPATKVLVLPYPNNPTGATMSEEELRKVADFCIRHDLIVISDEIYSELVYDKKYTSIASFPDMRERVIYVSGFSKSFAMTGWRIGYVGGPPEIISAMVKIHQYCIMCAPVFSQYAALAALRQGKADNFATVEEMREQYDRRRLYTVNSLRDVGLDCFMPTGAFYAFPSVKKLGMTGDEFCERLLAEKKVAVVPGSAFGESGTYNVRCSYAYSLKNLKNALERIADFVNEVKR